MESENSVRERRLVLQKRRWTCCRSFFATIVLVAILLIPMAVGFAFIGSNLERPRAPFLLVAMLNAVPPDGVPRKFAVCSDGKDEWTKPDRIGIGAVFLRRDCDACEVVAVGASVPDWGHLVDYNGRNRLFDDCCWNEHFKLDGTRIQPSHYSTNLEKYQVEIRGDQVWIENRFQFAPQ